jgi:hypothetical protein
MLAIPVMTVIIILPTLLLREDRDRDRADESGAMLAE